MQTTVNDLLVFILIASVYPCVETDLITSVSLPFGIIIIIIIILFFIFIFIFRSVC